MTQLIINRSAEMVNKLRDIKIYLDDVEVTRIADGCSQTLNLPPGNYQLHAKIDWCYSQKIDVKLNEDEQKEINLSAYKISSYTSIALLVLIAGSFIYDYLELPLLFDYNPLVLLTLLFFSINLFYLTIGRKRYLKLNMSV